MGRVFLRILGSTRAARISAASRSSAARRLRSWLRSLADLNRMVPSSMSFWPARRRSRFLTVGPSDGVLRQQEAQLRGARHLVDVLAAGARGTDELPLQFFVGNDQVRRDDQGGHCEASVVHDDLALRDRDGDAVLLEQPPDCAIHFRAHVVDALLRIGDPEPQLEFDAAVAEVHEARHRRRFAQYPRLPFAGGEQDPQRHFRIVEVAHANRQLQANARIGVAPIDHRIGDELLIRHQHFDAVAVADHHIAAAQFLDPAEVLGAGAALTGEADDVARA